MKTLRFWKMSGAGNDFVLLSGRTRGLSGPKLARRLCDRRLGIGADGLLILSRKRGHVRLDYWNADGSGAFCGNGSRCGALWAASHGWVRGRQFVLETNVGPLPVRLTARGRAEVAMPRPRLFKLHQRLSAGEEKLDVHFVNVGVPHAIIFVPDINKIDVKNLGRVLRFHEVFGKPGANIDFAQKIKQRLFLRTYERGIEDETPACGSGITAAAAVARRLGRVGDRVTVRTRGGSLSVRFDRDGGARLEGPGEIVFSGEIQL